MKINESGRIGAINSYSRNIESGQQTENKKSKRKDEVSISPEAMEMLKQQEQVNSSERAQRIQELKQQVASGTYKVDTEQLAERMMPYFKPSSEK
ncbi:flagellar biosynthesis anti-sigma factor FlgM [Paenibacillus shunpengii]|uniref:Negative regulator of flagellin synthesis n=2 Tax=Paenibacillus TaxID=44249 RepID=A0AAX3N0L4_9BACL|nr:MULTISPECIES: flagellar biosynthesis anti-sigma factor FlgM [Paenibacillus]WDH82245.1 flagellar biosynthesis anti-sigma factor FlgM [Paenibacillus urinalis]WDI01977.1 flagellar biosynthesis anti-sigma factor FlgM [Paenibacillus urinalis]GAK41263.1 negative regulator of flagellin synthesis [Paenibacillus sp. TCA20]